MTTRLALIVSGDRHGTDTPETALRWRRALEPLFRELRERYDDVILIHGAGGQSAGRDGTATGEIKGVDRVADDLGRHLGFTVLPMPADWDSHGRLAGPLRNQEMQAVQDALRDSGYHRLTVGCHDDMNRSKGTRGMLDISRTRGVSVIQVTSDGGRR